MAADTGPRASPLQERGSRVSFRWPSRCPGCWSAFPSRSVLDYGVILVQPGPRRRTPPDAGAPLRRRGARAYRRPHRIRPRRGGVVLGNDRAAGTPAALANEVWKREPGRRHQVQSVPCRVTRAAVCVRARTSYRNGQFGSTPPPQVFGMVLGNSRVGPGRVGPRQPPSSRSPTPPICMRPFAIFPGRVARKVRDARATSSTTGRRWAARNIELMPHDTYVLGSGYNGAGRYRRSSRRR
jgi:hypothetical protein